MKTNPCHNKLLSLIYSQNRRMDLRYAALSRKLAEVLRTYKNKSTRGPWVRNTELENKVNKILLEFNDDLHSDILEQSTLSWGLSDNCNDLLIHEYIKGLDIESNIQNEFLYRNTGALNSFLNRKENGIVLSDRVWKITQATKFGLEHFLKSGITEGRSAVSLATDVKKYLKEPNRRYRRIRNKEGKLIYSEPAKDFHPGRGVYRSSYQNALRLTSNEINIAYRSNDYERRRRLDFVVGITVHLSPAHLIPDICDHLTGDYPKGFKFVGWHPRCLCYTTAKLLPQREFLKILNGEQISSQRIVSSIPENAREYLNKHADTIKGWSNKPYFIKDNFKNVKGGFEIKKSVLL